MADLLEQINLYFSKIGLPLLVLVSLIGNALNVIILSRYKMRKYPCTLYFMVLSINNLLYSSTILIVSLLGDGYQIRISIKSSILCKFITYFGTLLSALSPYLIVLAAVDRWKASSSGRAGIGVRTTNCLIITIITFFSLLFIISLITADINAQDRIGCQIRGSAIFVQIYGIFQFIIFSLLAPLLMLIFGCLTIRNIKRNRMVAAVLPRYHRTESQLVRMLLVQVGVQLLLTLPICVGGLLLSLPTSYHLTPSLNSIYLIFRVVFQMSYAAPFFLYVISARTFRNDFIQLFIKTVPRRFQNRIHII